jgi:hypothetical protein
MENLESLDIDPGQVFAVDSPPFFMYPVWPGPFDRI